MNAPSDLIDIHKHLDYTGKSLRWFADHDYALAIIFAVSTFHILPFVIFLIPLVLFLKSLAGAVFIDLKVEDLIRANHNVPKRVFFRASKSSNCHVFSLPFFSIIYLSKQVLSAPESASSQAKISHELGHHAQHDKAVIILLVLSAAFWVFISLQQLVVIFSQKRESYYETGTGGVLYQTGSFWAIVMGMAMVTALVTLYKVVHRREYMADNFAAKLDYTKFINYLRPRSNPNVFRTQNRSLDRLYNAFCHPNYLERMQMQSELYQKAWYSYGLFSFVWAFFFGIMLRVCLIPSRTNMFGSIKGDITNVSGVIVLVVIAFAVGGFIKRSMFVEGKGFFTPQIFALFMGYATGFSLAMVSTALLEYLVAFDNVEYLKQSLFIYIASGLVFLILTILISQIMFWLNKETVIINFAACGTLFIGVYSSFTSIVYLQHPWYVVFFASTFILGSVLLMSCLVLISMISASRFILNKFDITLFRI